VDSSGVDPGIESPERGDEEVIAIAIAIAILQ